MDKTCILTQMSGTLGCSDTLGCVLHWEPYVWHVGNCTGVVFEPIVVASLGSTRLATKVADI